MSLTSMMLDFYKMKKPPGMPGGSFDFGSMPSFSSMPGFPAREFLKLSGFGGQEEKEAKDPIERNRKTLDTLRQKVAEMDYNPPEEKKRSFLEVLSDLVSTDQYALGAAGRNLLGLSERSGQGIKGVAEDTLEGLKAGVTGEGIKGDWQDNLRDLFGKLAKERGGKFGVFNEQGLSDTGNQAADVGINFMREMAGTAGNIFGSPSTYLTLGMGPAARKGAGILSRVAPDAVEELAKQGLKKLPTILSKEGQELAAKTLAKNYLDDVLKAGGALPKSYDDMLKELTKQHADNFARDASGFASFKPPIWREGGKWKFNIPFIKESEGYKGLPLITQKTFQKLGMGKAYDALKTSDAAQIMSGLLDKPLFKSLITQAKDAPENLLTRMFFRPVSGKQAALPGQIGDDVIYKTGMGRWERKIKPADLLGDPSFTRDRRRIPEEVFFPGSPGAYAADAKGQLTINPAVKPGADRIAGVPPASAPSVVNKNIFPGTGSYPGQLLDSSPAATLERTGLGNVVDMLGKTFVPGWRVPPALKALIDNHRMSKNADDVEILDSVNRIVRQVPDKQERALLSKHLDNPDVYPLPEKLKPVAAEIKAMQDPYTPGSFAAQEQDLGIIKNYIDNYMAHIYENSPDEVRKIISELADKNRISFGTSDRHKLMREIKTFDDAIEKGLLPKLDAAEVLGLRMAAGKKAIRGKMLVNNVKSLGTRFADEIMLNASAVPEEIVNAMARHFSKEMKFGIPDPGKYKNLNWKTSRQILDSMPEDVNATRKGMILSIADAVQGAVNEFRGRGKAVPEELLDRIFMRIKNRMGSIDKKARRTAAEQSFETFTQTEFINLMKDARKFIERGVDLPPGFVMTDDLFVKDLPGQKSFNPMPGWAVSEDTAKALISEFKPQITPPFLRFMDNVQNFWKGMVTLAPGFHTRNALGNLYNNALGGVGADKLSAYKNAMDVQLGKTDGKLLRLAGGVEMPLESIRPLAQKYGLIDTGLYGKDIDTAIYDEILAATGGQKAELYRLFKKFKEDRNLGAFAADASRLRPGQWISKLNRSVGSTIENNGRLAHFIAKLEDGYSPEEAAKSAKKYLFDYEDLTDTEKNVFKRIVPFYTWIRKNTALQWEEFIRKPSRFATIAKLKTALEGGSRQSQEYREENMPRWLKQRFHVFTPFQDSKGKQIIAKAGLPFEDLAQSVDPAEWIESIRPDVKEIFQQKANKDFFFDSPIVHGLEHDPELQTVKVDFPYKYLENVPVLGKLMKVKTVYDPLSGRENVEMDARLAHVLRGVFRPAREIGKATDPETDPILRVMNLMGPVTAYPLDRRRQEMSEIMSGINRYRSILKKLKGEQVRGGVGRGTGF